MGGSGINIIETKQDQKKSQFKKKIAYFLKSMIGKNLPISPYHTLFVG
jgi:hypothetical protein